MADDLTIEVTGSAEKAASALDKIIQKITDLQERFDKAAPSVSKFASQMEQIASSSKAFQAFQKMAGGIDKQAVSTKNAESKMAMYQARLDRANVSMERSRVQSEKLAASLEKVSEAQKIAEANSAAFSMSPADFAAKYNHSSNGGADLTPQTSEGTEAGPAPVNVPVEKFDVSKIQANIDSMKPKISIDADSAMAELQRMGEYIDGLRPRISGMSEEAQAQFNALAAKLELVSRQIDNQRNAYRGLQSAALKAEQEQGNGSDAYLKLEKRILSADAASQRLAATQERIKAQLSDIAAAAEGAGAGMSEAGEESEKGAKKAQSGWYQTWNMFSKMMIRIAAFRVFSAIQQGITTGLQDIALANNQANATMSALASNSLYLKNSLGAALMPVLQALVPVLNQVTDALANVFNTIGMLIGRIFNHATTAVIAKRANVDYAATISKAGDSAANTTKKVKELQRTVMGFDELNIMQKQISESEPASAAAKNPNPGMPAYGDMFETVKIPDWINNVGNFTDTIGKIIGGWWNGLTDAQKWGAGIGGTAGFIIGGIIGNLIGGPIGRIVGSILGGVIGTITGAWWAGLTAEEKWATGIGAGAGTVIGGIIGHLIGGKVGAAVGIALGGAAGIAIGKWWTDLTTPQKWSAGIGATAGTIIGGIVGGVLTGGNPIGIVVGVALGGTIGAIIGKWWAGLTTKQKWSVGIGAGAGTAIGGIIGGMIAGPIGAVIGGLLGGTIGTVIGNWWSGMTSKQKWSIGIGASAGTVIGGILGTLICPGIGTVLGAALGGTLGTVAGQAISKLTNPFKNIKWPKISTPHLEWTSGGWKATGWIYKVLDALQLPTQMPKLNVKWYAKGGLFDTPSLIGVGEAGPEAVMPLNDKVFTQIAQGIVENGQSNGSGSLDTERIIQRMDRMERAIRDMKLYLYTDDRKIAESSNRGNRLLGRTAPTA